MYVVRDRCDLILTRLMSPTGMPSRSHPHLAFVDAVRPQVLGRHRSGMYLRISSQTTETYAFLHSYSSRPFAWVRIIYHRRRPISVSDLTVLRCFYHGYGQRRATRCQSLRPPRPQDGYCRLDIRLDAQHWCHTRDRRATLVHGSHSFGLRLLRNRYRIPGQQVQQGHLHHHRVRCALRHRDLGHRLPIPQRQHRYCRRD